MHILIRKANKTFKQLMEYAFELFICIGLISIALNLLLFVILGVSPSTYYETIVCISSLPLGFVWWYLGVYKKCDSNNCLDNITVEEQNTESEPNIAEKNMLVVCKRVEKDLSGNTKYMLLLRNTASSEDLRYEDAINSKYVYYAVEQKKEYKITIKDNKIIKINSNKMPE